MAATRMAAAGPTRPEAGRPTPSFRKYNSLRVPNLLGAVTYYIDRLLVSFYDFRPIGLCQRQQWHRTRGSTKEKNPVPGVLSQLPVPFFPFPFRFVIFIALKKLRFF